MRRSVLAALFAMSLSAPALAQLVVVDPANVVQHGIIDTISRTLVTINTQIERGLTHFGSSLRLYEDLGRYHAPAAPPWVTRQVDHAMPATVAFLAALNNGDPTGYLLEQSMVARLELDGYAVLPESLRLALANLDIADSALRTGVDTAGRVRGSRVVEMAALLAQVAHLRRTTGSMTAALDHISGSAVMRSWQQSARLDLESSLTEQALVQAKRARDAEMDALVMRANGMAKPPNMAAGSGTALGTWRQP